VAIYRMLHGLVFNDQDVKAMTTAYEAVLADLGLTDRTDPLTEIVVRRLATGTPPLWKIGDIVTCSKKPGKATN
jgi:hypothetical protein